MTPLKIVFLGSDPIALPLLNWLRGEGSGLAEVVALFTQPDRPVGRGQKVQPNAIKMWAQSLGLPVFQPEKLTDAVRGDLAALGADVALVMAYGHILRDEFIVTPRLGTLNLHASILPRYRGASPIQSAIAHGERETGVTLMRIVRRLDAGPVADIERVPIAPHDTAIEIEAKLSGACVPLLARTLPKFREGNLEFIAQDEPAATYCRRLEKDDGVLDFAAPAQKLAARINGLFPWPACSVEINGQLVKVGLAEVGAREICHPMGDKPAGTVLPSDDKQLVVTAGDRECVRLLRLQRAGGKMLATAEFLRGFPVMAGTVLPSRRMPPLVAREPFRR